MDSNTTISTYTYWQYTYWQYPRFNVPNKKIATEPFPTQTQDKEIVNGVLRIKQRGSLQALKVVFGNETLTEGHVVFVRADQNVTTSWGKEIFEAEGKKFILVPEEALVLVDRIPKSEVK